MRAERRTPSRRHRRWLAAALTLALADGLNSFVPDDVIRAFAEAYYPREAVDGLIRRANESGGGDNITAVLMRSEA